MSPEKQALLDALLVERFTHLPQSPAQPAETAQDVARHLRIVVDNTPDHRSAS